MLMDEAQLNLGHEVRVAKRAYTLVKPILGRKVPFFPRLKMSYLKDSSYQLLGELSIRLIGLTELTDSVGEDLWDYQPCYVFLTLQRCKVTVLHLLDRELYCLKLIRDYVTTLTNYKGWVTTTKVG